MSDLRERSAVMLRDISATLATCLGVPADLLDGEWVDELAADMAVEWSMWMSAAVVMPDWTQPIGVEF